MPCSVPPGSLFNESEIVRCLVAKYSCNGATRFSPGPAWSDGNYELGRPASRCFERRAGALGGLAGPAATPGVAIPAWW